MSEQKGNGADERRRILSMVQDGTITAAEAAEMLSAIDEAETRAEPVVREAGSPKWIHIQVIDDNDRVDVRLPFALVRLIERFIPQQARREMEKNGLNINELMQGLEHSGQGKLVEIQEDGGGYVAITVE